MCCGKTLPDCAKRCLCCFNSNNATAGILLVVGTVWMKGWETMGDLVHYIPAIEVYMDRIIILGVIISIVSIIGCVGAMIRHKYILMAYFVILGILALTKLIIAIVYFAKAAKDVSPDVIEMLQVEFDKNRATYMGLETLLQCCGVTGIESYYKIGEKPSIVCCDITGVLSLLPGACTAAKARPGCESKVWPYLRTSYRILAGFLLVLVLFEILLLGLTFLLIWDIRKKTLSPGVTSPSGKPSSTGTPTVKTSQTAQSQGTAGSPNTQIAGQGQGSSTAGTPPAPTAGQGQGSSTAGSPTAPTAGQGQISSTAGTLNTPTAGQGQGSSTVGTPNTPTAGQGQGSSTAGTPNTPTAGQGQGSSTAGKLDAPKTGQGPGK